MNKTLLTVAMMTTGLCTMASNDDELFGIPIPPKPATSQGQVVVYETIEEGPIKPHNAVNGAPHQKNTPMFTYWKNLNIPYGRTHDFGLIPSYGGAHSVDVASIFRDFDADENDPASYDFTNTDMVLERMREAGTEPFYRLGAEYEGWLRKNYTIYAPKDPAKWARICEHIIAHYNEGWANGYKWNVQYWEIWNEADLMTAKNEGRDGLFWKSSREKFHELFKTTVKHLKERFPDLKIGGAAFADAMSPWAEEMLKDFLKDGIELDFYSWHQYSAYPKVFASQAKKVRDTLNAIGLTKTESICDEWNYIKGWTPGEVEYSTLVERGTYAQKGGAFVSAAITEMQHAPVDMAMLYDAATWSRMNTVFDNITGYPLPAYYALYAWNKLRNLGTSLKVTTSLDDVYIVAAHNKEGKLGILITRYDEDNNITSPIRITIRLSSGSSFSTATCHLTDDFRTYTETPLELNKDGSADLELRPCSFAFIEL